jgi:FMN reductase [NAD(P)H]
MNASELFNSCRTFRRFEQKPVPEELMREMIDAARISSCGGNLQSLRYVAVSSPETVARMQDLVKWAAYLPREQGTPVAGEQPTAFVVITKVKGAGAFSDVDVGIAARTITAIAWEAGVGSCIMGAINGPKIAELLEIPQNQTPRIAIALGYPSHSSTVVDLPEDGSVKYWLDADRNYFVPKRSLDEVARFV